jgi:hypothetical protein
MPNPAFPEFRIKSLRDLKGAIIFFFKITEDEGNERSSGNSAGRLFE